jgi:nucleoside-diphosphate-sugar epimerase
MILVTGGTGFLGTRILAELAEKRTGIRAIRRPGSSLHLFNKVFRERFGENDMYRRNIEWVEGDVTDYYSIEDALLGVSRVIHAAGLVSFHQSDKEKMMEINAKGTENLVNACLYMDVQRLVHISSVAAIGRAEVTEKLSEKTVWKNSPANSNYAISKYAAEREVWRGCEEGLQTVILNPGIILGSGDWNTGTPSLFTKVWEGMPFYTEGSNGVIDVNDVASISVKMMLSDISGERYILVSENMSYLELFNAIAKALDKPVPVKKAGTTALRLAMLSDAFREAFGGRKALITRETVRNSMSKSVYDTSAIQTTMTYTFRPALETIQKTAQEFLKAHKQMI